MVVMNIRSAIVAESTLSFMGIGLPLEVISWGSMLSLSEKALMTKAWWIILIPGVFLIVTLLSFTSIGNYLRKTEKSVSCSERLRSVGNPCRLQLFCLAIKYRDCYSEKQKEYF